MPTKRNRLSKIVLVPLFVFIIGALVEVVSPQSSPVELLCLRRCHLRAARSSNVKVSRFDCYRHCINRSKKVRDQQALTANVFKQQRFRKALKPIPDCLDSSPDQTVDWNPSEVNVSFGQYQNTSHWYANVSWTHLNDSYGNWIGILVRLVVLPSDFTRPMPVICSVHPKNRTFLNINISSYQYRYPDAIYLKVLALPYSREDVSDISIYEPLTSPPTHVQATVFPSSSSSAVNQTTALVNDSDCPDSSPDQTVNWRPSEVNVSFGQYQNTSHWYSNVSWTHLNDSYGNWTGILVRLVVPPSDFTRPIPVICSLHPKNRTFLNINISSYQYRYPGAIHLKVLAFPYSRKEDVSDTSIHKPIVPSSSTVNQTTAAITSTTPHTSDCSLEEYGDLEWYPSKVDGRFFKRSNEDWFANISWTPLTNISKQVGYGITNICLKVPKKQTSIIVDSSHGWKYPQSISVSCQLQLHHQLQEKSDVIITVFASVGGFFVLLLLAALLVFRRRRKSSSTNAVTTVPTLRLSTREVFADTVVKSVYSSSKIIAVVSKNFVESNHCEFELNQAVHRLMNHGDDCLIVIKYDDVDVNSLPMMAMLLNRSYIDFTKRTDRSTWESKLVDILKTVAVEEEESVHRDGNTNNNLSQGIQRIMMLMSWCSVPGNPCE
ncbi:TIR domain [Desmophyllum pertusum]|uniref:TIR domain n=1 Tax=Desmophyllum pertusum TaxID=174260 RepID=A0A9W9ZJN8_9CNID|nr:TIR domain [Desmophyllum pertusum]